MDLLQVYSKINAFPAKLLIVKLAQVVDHAVSVKLATPSMLNRFHLIQPIQLWAIQLWTIQLWAIPLKEMVRYHHSLTFASYAM